jgi:hypothetical protein
MKQPHRAAASGDSPVHLVLLLLKLLWMGVVVTTPLLGVWVSSSLAAYQNGPVGVAVAAGLLLFPGLPLGWEALSSYRRQKKLRGVVKPRVLTLWDRLILRTLAINLLFLGGLLALNPKTAFGALSTRGDWMLEGRKGETVDAIRKGLFRAADRLEWLYLATHENPFRKTDGDDVPPIPSAQPTGKPADEKPPESPQAKRPGERGEWPSAAELHHTVKEIPSSSEDSIARVARYIEGRESDPFLKVKAVHDYVADRVAYDAPSYVAKRYPPQDAETVFRTRKSVCAGYAYLFEAIAKAAGIEAYYVGGEARGDGTGEAGEGHAWNAVRIGGRYYLLDATWDSGSVSGTTFTKGYKADYLFTPPEIFGVDHFPDDARWQLRATPMSRGDFMRQAMMTPAFHAERRTLVSPLRSQVSVQGAIDIQMKNPDKLFTLASFVALGAAEGDRGTRCRIDAGEDTRVHCDFPAPGRWVVKMFSNKQEFGSYHYIGQIEANSGG